MLCANVELLHGTYRADPDGTAHTGRLAQGEWPPAPARLFDALVAADGTRDRSRWTDGAGLRLLESAPAPTVQASALNDVCHQPLEARYVAEWDTKFSRDNQSGEVHSHQEYVGRKGTLVRPGFRVAPRMPTVRYLWDVEANEAQLQDLSLRAARVGYLGCADSPVRVRFEQSIEIADASEDLKAYEPDSQGDLVVGTVRPGRLGFLDAAFDTWLEGGRSVARSRFPALATKAIYRSPRTVRGYRPNGGIVASLVLRPAVSGRRVAALAATFKAAVLDRYQTSRNEEPPPFLHGHGFPADGYDLARFLALPDVGHQHARGRIHGVALWLPPDCGAVHERALRDVVHSIQRLVGRGVNVRTEVWERNARNPRSASPGRWYRPSRRWITAFPAVHERHVPLTLEEVARWCEHAGLPEPVAFRASRDPLMAGGISLAPAEIHRTGRSQRPYSHFELVFATPIQGPVVIGSGRQRGLGLCLPVGDRSPLPRAERRRHG